MGSNAAVVMPHSHYQAPNSQRRLSIMTRIWVACALLAVSTAMAAPLDVHIIPHTHDDVGWLYVLCG